MTAYVDTQGTVLKMGNGASPEVFTAIPQIVSIDGPTANKSEIDTTHLGSTAKESRAGLRDFGSMTLEIEWDENDTQHAAIRTAFDAGTVKNFQLINTSSPQKTASFSGWFKTLPQTYNADDVVRSSAELRLTGALTWA